MLPIAFPSRRNPASMRRVEFRFGERRLGLVEGVGHAAFWPVRPDSSPFSAIQGSAKKCH